MILITNVIEGIEKKNSKLIAYGIAIALPAIWFIMTTPGGTLQIDNFKFFWQ